MPPVERCRHRAINKTGILLLILRKQCLCVVQESSGLGHDRRSLWLYRGDRAFFHPRMAPGWRLHMRRWRPRGRTISAMAEISYPAFPAMRYADIRHFGLDLFVTYGLIACDTDVSAVVVFSNFGDRCHLYRRFGARLFHIHNADDHEANPIGIGFLVLVTGVAAFNSFWILTFERNAHRSPRYMEWYCGFSLLVTLVWLYLEMIRLLGKISKK